MQLSSQWTAWLSASPWTCCLDCHWARLSACDSVCLPVGCQASCESGWLSLCHSVCLPVFLCLPGSRSVPLATCLPVHPLLAPVSLCLHSWPLLSPALCPLLSCMALSSLITKVTPLGHGPGLAASDEVEQARSYPQAPAPVYTPQPPLLSLSLLPAPVPMLLSPALEC